MRRTSSARRSSRSGDSSSSSLDEDLDEETRTGFIETMQGQVRRLTKLSTDLLDLSRVDAGQLTVQLEPVDLRAVGTMLTGELEHVATSTNHALESETGVPVWCVGDDAGFSRSAVHS